MSTASGDTPFSNQAVDPGTLPALTALDFSPVSPSYRTLNMAVAGFVTALLIGIVTALRFQPIFALPTELIHAYMPVAGGLLAIGLIWLGYHFLADKRVGYALRELDISLRRGLIFRKVVCQPILRVQHVELKRGPLERLAGLATLQVFSAGGAMHTFEVPGLTVTRAEQLRQYILDHKDLSAR